MDVNDGHEKLESKVSFCTSVLARVENGCTEAVSAGLVDSQLHN